MNFKRITLLQKGAKYVLPREYEKGPLRDRFVFRSTLKSHIHFEFHTTEQFFNRKF